MAPAHAMSSRRVSDLEDSTASSSQARKRKSGEDFEEGEASETRASKRFRHLKPRTKRIAQHQITSKWSALPAPAQQQIQELFKAAKRPVILSRQDERRRREVEIVLDYMVRRLEKQLPRMPFPPKSKDVHFDLDRLVARNHMLESQMTPASHSIELLKAEIEKEEVALQRDREGLRRLEKNFGAEQKEVGRQARKVHHLLESTRNDNGGVRDGAEQVNLRVSRTKRTAPDELPPEVQSLSDQLLNHLSSMQANASQVEGVRAAIARADVAVERVLC